MIIKSFDHTYIVNYDSYLVYKSIGSRNEFIKDDLRVFDGLINLATLTPVEELEELVIKLLDPKVGE